MQNNYDLDCYMPISAGLIIKLITVVIYGYHNRLECLSLSTILKACQGQTLQLITESVNYGCNMFYDTGPRVRPAGLLVSSWRGQSCPWRPPWFASALKSNSAYFLMVSYVSTAVDDELILSFRGEFLFEHGPEGGPCFLRRVVAANFEPSQLWADYRRASKKLLHVIPYEQLLASMHLPTLEMSCMAVIMFFKGSPMKSGIQN